jgi:HAMP domain-containing protein
VLSYRNNPQTQELSKFRGAVLLHNNVFLTDRYGGLVAVQGEKPAQFAYRDEAWWQTAWNDSQGGIYVGNLKIDPETKIAYIFIAVGVLNPQTNRRLGVLASTYELSAIQREIGDDKTQSSVAVHLIARDGSVIAGPDRNEIGRPAWQGLFEAGLLASNPPPEPGVLQGFDSQSQAALIAHTPLGTSSGLNLGPLRSLGWQVVVSDTQADALALVTTSTKVASLVGLVVIVLVVIAAITTARVITRPIENLTTVAAAITAGKLSQRAEPVGPVELVTLAEAFNTLTGQLRGLINNLQEQVVQRTAQLEARAEQLATLNRITQAVSSVQELHAALKIVAYEMVHLFKIRNSGIACWMRTGLP